MADRPVALVTGGAKRVGRAIVQRLADGGFDVAFTFNKSREEAEAFVATLRSGGRRAEAVQANFDAPLAADETADWLKGQFDRVDVLVNCASLYLPDDQDVGPSSLLQRRLLDVNCVAPTTLMTRLAPLLRSSGGCVVNMLDILVEKPWPKYSAYCASKAALHTATLAFARKLAPQVRVNGIAPGVVDWPADMPDADRANYLSRVPLGRAGTPKDVADLVHFLATAAPYVTGQIIRLDGGRSLV